MDKRKLRNRNICNCMLSILLLLQTFGGIYGLYRIFCEMPQDDSYALRPLENSLLNIREKTPEDTVLASWWDKGYFMEEKAQRKTLFDGGSQNNKRAFFISRAFVTKDENLSANIIHMFAGSGDAGCNLMLSTFGETDETIFFIDELLSGSKSAARNKLLQKDISEDLADEITELLFPDNLPLTECIITADMPWFAAWFPQFGLTATEKNEQPITFSVKEHLLPVDLTENGRTVVDTQNGYYVILENDDSGWHACTSSTEEPSDEQPLYIEKVIISDSDGYREYDQNNAPPEKDPDPDSGNAMLPMTIIITGSGQETTLSLVSTSLTDSVFGKLLYFGGKGLTRYETEPELTNDVLVYRINIH